MPSAKSLGFAWNGKQVPAAGSLPGLLTDEEPDPYGVGRFLQAKAREREAAGARPGLGISPQVEALAAPAETLMDLGFTLAERRLPGAEDAQGSMIPTKKNLAKFIQLMVDAPIRKAEIRNYPEIAYGKAFMDARYPIRSKRGTRDMQIYHDDNTAEVGSFYPGENRAMIASQQGRGRGDNPVRAIDALAHESQHLLDATRKASPIKELEMYNRHERLGGTYVTPEEDYGRYKTQRFEKRGFQAGKTAREAHDKFIGLLRRSDPRKKWDKRLEKAFGPKVLGGK